MASNIGMVVRNILSKKLMGGYKVEEMHPNVWPEIAHFSPLILQLLELNGHVQ